MKKILLFIFITFITINITLSQVNWSQYQGPYGGNITALTWVGDTLFCGSQQGSVYASYNKGDSWQYISSLNIGEIKAMIYYNSRLIVSWSSSTYMSNDNGLSWSLYPTISGAYQFYIFKNKLYAGTNTGVFVYDSITDAWSDKSFGLDPINAPFSVARNVQCISSVDTVLFCGTLENGLFYSTDLGENWLKTLPSSGLNTNGFSKLINYHDTLFASVNESGIIYCSVDTGRTWNVIPLLQNVNSFLNDGFTIYNDQLYHGTKSGLYKFESTNSSWNLINTESYNYLYSKDTIFFANNAVGLYRWNIENQNFSFSNTGINTSIVYGMGIFNNVLYSATSVGCFYTANDGETWNVVAETKNINCVDVYTRDTMIYLSTTNGILASSLNSSGWIHLDNGITTPIIWQIKTIDSLMLAATENGIFKSNDFGLNWSLVNGYPGQFLSIAYDSNIVLFGNSHALYKLSPDAMNIELVGFENRFISAISIFKNEIFVSIEGDSAGIYKSTDSCLSWSKISDISVTDIIKRGENNLYTTGYSYISYSSDNGTTWDSFSEAGTPQVLIGSFLQGDSCFYVGTYGKSIYKRKYLDLTDCNSDVYNIFSSTISNLGINTTVENLKSNLQISHGATCKVYRNNIEITNQSVVQNGDIVKIVAENGISEKLYNINNSVSIKSNGLTQDVVYPNPATTILYLKMTGSNNDKIEIYNTLGKCVLNGRIAANQIDVSSLSRGFYTLKITKSDEIIITKFLKN